MDLARMQPQGYCEHGLLSGPHDRQIVRTAHGVQQVRDPQRRSPAELARAAKPAFAAGYRIRIGIVEGQRAGAILVCRCVALGGANPSMLRWLQKELARPPRSR
jgi:hypothetical protein